MRSQVPYPGTTFPRTSDVQSAAPSPVPRGSADRRFRASTPSRSGCLGRMICVAGGGPSEAGPPHHVRRREDRSDDGEGGARNRVTSPTQERPRKYRAACEQSGGPGNPQWCSDLDGSTACEPRTRCRPRQRHQHHEGQEYEDAYQHDAIMSDLEQVGTTPRPSSDRARSTDMCRQVGIGGEVRPSRGRRMVTLRGPACDAAPKPDALQGH